MDKAIRTAIRKAYKENNSDIIKYYPRYSPYFIDWVSILSPIENNIWLYVRKHCLPFYPQFPVGPYFIDFADPVKKFAIEADGKAFHQDKIADMKRQGEIEQQGYMFFRFDGKDTFPGEDEDGGFVKSYAEEELILLKKNYYQYGDYNA